MPAESLDTDSITSRFPQVAGVVLAGGKSKRYGSNKAFARLGGIPLIERILRVLASTFVHVYIITNSPDEYSYLGLPMYRDIIKGLGPVGGIYTALRVMKEEGGFFVGCDLPLLNRDLIRYMVERAPGYDVVMPKVGEYIEPLHAYYGKECITKIEGVIKAQDFKVSSFLSQVRVLYITEEEVRRFDPDLLCFMNVNTPEDLRRLEKL